jgi:CID domain
LTWIAEDYTDSESSAAAIYRIIRQRLLTSSRDNILPVVYVIDSILKNVKGFYLSIIEKDAIEWMSIVFHKLHDSQRMRLEKVWRTWNEFKLFPHDSWKLIGSCFEGTTSISNVLSPAAVLETAGITRTVRTFPFLLGKSIDSFQTVHFTYLSSF